MISGAFQGAQKPPMESKGFSGLKVLEGASRTPVGFNGVFESLKGV